MSVRRWMLRVGRRSRVRRAVTRYRCARRAQRMPASRQSRNGLDWTNFFLADVQVGFGAFVAFYLAGLGWSQANVGLALSAGSLAGVLSQLPGGALADALRWKRALVAAGIVMICMAAVILALIPTYPLVFAAEVLHGLTAGLVTPALAAISLGLVGRRAMSARTGRNFRFAAFGNALTAGVLGLVGQFLAPRAIFLAAAALCAPALLALRRIHSEEIDYARARNAGTGEAAGKWHRVRDVFRNRRLLVFAGSLILFQLANAALLPLVGTNLGANKAGDGSIRMSGLIIVPQIVVALLSPWIGYFSELRGRKPLLLLGLGLEAVRAALFAFVTDYSLMVAIQLLDGATGAIINVLTVLVITDLTTGTGRFNLAQGAIATGMGIAASLSTSIFGFVFQSIGHSAGFLTIAAVAAAAAALAWLFLPETKPEKYID
jgi:predicted MFS family arabinose efflux permease